MTGLRRRNRTKAFLGVLSCLVATCGGAFSDDQNPDEVSKETTFVLGLLLEDGTVDFLKAYEEKANAGITPENNALTGFWKAWGPESIDEWARELYLKKLGLPDLPEKGAYFVHIDTVSLSLEEDDVEVPDDSYDEQLSAMNGPWRKG